MQRYLRQTGLIQYHTKMMRQCPQCKQNPKIHVQTRHPTDELTQQAFEGVFMLQKGRVVYCNPSFARMVGHTVNTLQQWSRRQLKFVVHPEDRARVLRQHLHRLRGRPAPSECDCRMIRSDGRMLWVRSYISMIEYRGRPAVRVACIDVTAQVQAEEAYRTLVDHSIQGLLIVQRRKIVYANPAYCALSGYTADELYKSSSMKFEKTIYPEDRPRMIERYRRRLAGRPYSPHYDARMLRKDGQVRVIEVFVSDTRFRGSPAVQAAVVDVTERREAEDAYRTLVEMSPHGIVITQRGCIVFANPAYCRLSGYKKKELYAFPPMGFSRTIHPHDRRQALARYHQRMKDMRPSERYQARLVRKNGVTLWVELHSVGIVYRGEQALQTMFTDITDRKRAEEEAQQRTAQLHAVSLQMIDIEEKARERIGHALHEDLQQTLVALKYKISHLQESVSVREAQRVSKAAHDILDRAIAQTRSLSVELMPPMFPGKDLKEDIEWLVAEMREKFGLSVRLRSGTETVKLSDAVREFLVRAVRELLFNVVRHANTTMAAVAFKSHGNRITLEVKDKGRGMSPKDRSGDRIGLITLRERAGYLGGELRVESSTGKGTCATLILPME